MGLKRWFQAALLWVTASLALLLFARSLSRGHGGRGASLQFEGFDNESGTPDGSYLAPNFVHFLRFGQGRFSFVDVVCLLAAFKNQRPDRLYIHTNDRPRGHYWNVLRKTEGLAKTLRIRPVKVPTHIFGQKINYKWRRFHGGDVTRLRILMTYGGIFLDNDSYLVRSLDDFRRYEMAIGWRPGKHIQNQVIVAHKDARFLRLWLDSYRDSYRPNLWYYNAGQLPTERILDRQPWLVHRVDTLFGVYGVVRKVFQSLWPEWKNYYAIHLQVRHQYLLKNISSEATFPVVFTDENVHKYPIAFRDMAYEVYPFVRGEKGAPKKRGRGRKSNRLKSGNRSRNGPLA